MARGVAAGVTWPGGRRVGRRLPDAVPGWRRRPEVLRAGPPQRSTTTWATATSASGTRVAAA